MSSYLLSILIEAKDEASGVINGVGGALEGLGKFALGAGIAGAAAGIAGLVASINEAAQSQDAIAGLDAVLQATGAAAKQQADEYAKASQQQITTTRLSQSELAKLNSQLNDTQLHYNTLTASIQEEKERIRQLTEQYGENGLVVLKEKARLAEMENQVNSLSGTMGKLSGQIASGSQVLKTTLANQLGLVAPAAQMSRQELLDLAGAMQRETKFSDESVISAEKVLLTFRSIGAGVFPDAIKAATDLSTVMGTDLQSATVMLGKALNDPVEGLTALRRVGISFSKQQEDQIKDLMKHGKLLEAQKIILGEVNAEMGGAAVAAGKTWSGQLTILQNQFSDLLETIGGPFLPILQQGASALTAFIANPEVQAGIANFAQGLATGLAGAFQQGIGFMQNVALPVLQQIGNWFMTVGIPAIQDFAATAGPVLQGAFAQGITFIQGVVIPALAQFGGWIQTSLIPALVQFGGFLQANVLPYLIQFGTWLGGTILTAAQQLGGWLMGSLVPALVQMGTTIATAAMPVLQQLGGWIQSALIPALQQFAGFVGPILQQAFAWLGTFVIGTLIPALTQLGVWILTKGLPALGDFAGVVSGVLNEALRQVGPLWQGITTNFQKAVQFVSDTAKNFAALADTVKKDLAPILEWFDDTILSPLQQTFAALVGLAESFLEWLQKIADMLANMELPDWLQRHSPSPLEQALMGTNAELRDMAMLAPAAFRAYGGMNWQGMPFIQALPQSAQIGAPTSGQHAVNFHGPVTIVAHDYDDFVRQLNERVNIEQRFMSYAGN